MARASKVLFPLACLGSAAALLGVHRQLADSARTMWLSELLYWAMVAVLAAAAASGIAALREARFRPLGFLRRSAAAIALSLALTLTCRVLAPPEMRMQFDETNLVSASLSMHSARNSQVTMSAVRQGAALVPMEGGLDKRPPLFPFLVSGVHALAGPSIGSAYALNSALLFVLLLTVSLVIQARLDLVSALAGPVLVVGVPIVVLTAESAGFDLLAATMLLLTALSGAAYARRPTAARFAWLCSIGVAFAYCRYESVAVAATIGLASLWAGRKRGFPPKWLLVSAGCAAALLLVPWALQAIHASQDYFYEKSVDLPKFHPRYLAAHGLELARRMSDFRFSQELAAGPSILGALGLAWALLRRRMPRDASLAIVLAALASHLAINLLHFGGHAAVPGAIRLYLPLAVASGLGPVWLRGLLGPRRSASLALLAASVLWTVPRLVAIEQVPFTRSLSYSQGTAAMDDLLPRLGDEGRQALWVTLFSPYLILKGYQAADPEFVREAWPALKRLQAAGSFRQVLFVETAVDRVPVPKDLFDLDEVATRSGSLRMRVLRLKRWPGD